MLACLALPLLVQNWPSGAELSGAAAAQYAVEEVKDLTSLNEGTESLFFLTPNSTSGCALALSQHREQLTTFRTFSHDGFKIRYSNP